MNWLAELKPAHRAQQIVLQEYIDAANECTRRIQRITEQIQSLVAQWSRASFVRAYQALRGVSLIVATTVVSEIGDMNRFQNPKQLMAYLDLVPSEHSSGNRIRRGSITKTGNRHVRRVPIEAAWTCNLRVRKTKRILKRQQGLDDRICEISWKAQLRLCGKYRRLFAHGKLPHVDRGSSATNTRLKENSSKFKFLFFQDGKLPVFAHPDLEIGEYNLRIDPLIVGNELLV